MDERTIILLEPKIFNRKFFSTSSSSTTFFERGIFYLVVFLALMDFLFGRILGVDGFFII
jgi:hypothetical protein